ncbi:hypothetical protein [Halomonas heilongjiangensis]|uniref:hypothetical protein n=1 Tax=Halomonas heilongjiangensis TaxID=1387883 RepID=UPI000D758A94|nr:hypothetical protein [Halomonas heilongjiangensis]PXX89425.1 hypothetical protein CR158_10765 [Halomonas heilongjiangensis]
MSMELKVEYQLLEAPNNHIIKISTDGYQLRHTKKKYELNITITNLTKNKSFKIDVEVLYGFNDRPISELLPREIAIVKKWFVFQEELRDNSKLYGIHPVPVINCVKSFCSHFDNEYELYEMP